MRNDILFLTLKIFSATGGIEKVCRGAGKAMYENATSLQKRFKVYSMHDSDDAAIDNEYFPSENFFGFGANKFHFVKKSIRQGVQSELVILSHINLLLPGYIIKKMSPDTRLVLMAHGIEVWDKISPSQKLMLDSCDEILCVSKFTSDKLQTVHGINPEKCTVLNNCLDPFLPLPKNLDLSDNFYKKYHCSRDQKIILTLTRLSATEHYKGYDIVLWAIKEMNIPDVRYLLAGKYDSKEKANVDKLIAELGLQDKVILPGFVPEEDVGYLFKMANVYAMPSRKEGFGIVFIEAMYYGLPVIAGNADGSVDALLNGDLGILVDPISVKEVRDALEIVLNNPEKNKPNNLLLQHYFSYENYKVNLNVVLDRQMNFYSKSKRGQGSLIDVMKLIGFFFFLNEQI
jgi:glycosyltransferase involved in cell wall biosynthesis